MHSERNNEIVVDKYISGNKQGKLSFVNCDDCNRKNDEKTSDDKNAAYLNHQLEINGIVLTKLQIPKWSSNIMSDQNQNSIVNTFYLGKQPILGQQQIIEKQVLKNQDQLNDSDKKPEFNKQDIYDSDQKSILGNLNRTSIVPINSISSMINYNSISDCNQTTIDSIYSSNYHFNNGYISSDAHSLEYNEFNDQNPYNSQSPINEKNFNHDDSTKAAVKELLLPILLSGFGNMGAGMILDKVQNWEAFKKIPQLIVLVPALLGLKGNQ